MNLLVTLAACLLISFFISLAARKLKISTVVGLILAGILLGSPFLRNAILEPNTEFIVELGDVGLLALMFLAGLEISWSMLVKEKRDSIYLAFSAFLLPLLLGFFVFYFLGFSWLTALTVGICMSITAEPTTARVLLELGKLKTRIGSLLIGIGIIDDVLGITALSVVAVLAAGFLLTKEVLMLAGAILAFFLGIAAHKLVGREKRKIRYLEKILLTFVVPFFFIAMGLYFSLQSLVLNVSLAVLIVTIATCGKIFGSLVTKPFIKLKLKQLHLVGWGMNSRGAIELVLAFTAFKLGLVDQILFSGLMLMALLTTLTFPFVLRALVRRDPAIMD